ncbi:GNAT family N-acetyltransferase [Natronomonas salina]|uniref:GNAT family N-acetyltransferase n=1 Tax=Natronomonas salina TaxID=1710540 RepID=UPI0015B468F4|nr:GNAT family N-acetyltransferase [Natronomonas salina]QLD89375.1 GNAT family N-acetyltransferase [Natronomonas salina]
MSREYPDEVAGPYEAPPRTFTDREEREIAIRRYDDDYERLVEMYLSFDPEDRAQGIPPTEEKGIRKWLDALLEDDCVNVVAWHDDDPVGHALLVPDRHDASELAIFVLREYQEAGIGTQLIKGLLGAGREAGLDRVWLTVERWNHPATALYRKVGFEPSDDGGFELEMAARLVGDDEDGDD